MGSNDKLDGGYAERGYPSLSKREEEAEEERDSTITELTPFLSFKRRWCTCSGLEGKHYILLLLCILIVVAVTLSITLTVINGKDTATEETKPHVVLIIADDMGYNDIGYYNAPQFDDIRTPHLDKMASEGLRLDRYYGQSICTPARAALFTGRYPYRYGMQGARPILYGAKLGLPLSEEQILPQVMKEGGYKTYLVGKWHLGYSKWDYTPIKRGFDYFFGMYGGFADYFTHESAEPEGTLAAFDLHQHSIKDVKADGTVEETAQQNMDLIRSTWRVYSEKLFTDKAVDIIREHDVTEPLFLTVSYMNPHSPLQTLQEDDQKVPKTVKNEIRQKFSALMASLDAGVQQISEALKARGIYDETLVIFTGDNGGAVQGPIESRSLGGTNWPLRGSKWTIWDGGVRVPAFVRGPGVQPGTNSSKLFHLTDWLPTLASLAGVTPKKKLDGVDQLDLIRGNRTVTPRQDLVVELDPAYKQASYIRDNFKLIIGDPAPKPYNDVYPPLTKAGEDWYFDGNKWGRNMYGEVSKICDEKLVTFEEDMKDPRYDFRDITSIGEFTHSEIRLYDLDNDPAEEHDLFTEQERFRTLAKDMYDHLAGQCKEMSDLIFFVGAQYLEPEKAYTTYTFDPPLAESPQARDEVNKWKPWLPN